MLLLLLYSYAAQLAGISNENTKLELVIVVADSVGSIFSAAEVVSYWFTLSVGTELVVGVSRFLVKKNKPKRNAKIVKMSSDKKNTKYLFFCTGATLVSSSVRDSRDWEYSGVG